MRGFSSFLKRADAILNSESLDSQFGQSGVYDTSAIALNGNRIPGARARDKNSDRKGKGTGWKGQGGVNWAGRRERTLAKVIIIHMWELEMRAGAIIKRT